MHMGPSPNCGHYYLFGRVSHVEQNGDNMWMCFDDSSVTKMSYSSVHRLIHSMSRGTPYLMFYSQEVASNLVPTMRVETSASLPLWLRKEVEEQNRNEIVFVPKSPKFQRDDSDRDGDGDRGRRTHKMNNEMMTRIFHGPTTGGCSDGWSGGMGWGGGGGPVC
jgi:hypothetical protein